MSELNDYQSFVYSVTSEPSKAIGEFAEVTAELHEMVNIPLLLTAAIGMSSENGEFSEIVKKCVFQGKEFNRKERYHMKRELGDILWYLANAATALGYNLDDIMFENIQKLEARYPNGFEVFRSENRAEGDL
jgi:NTP pyrophosphatase (non-canonical NTP hydrolase)